MHAERLLQNIRVPSLVLIAQAVFLSECRQTDRHDWTPYPRWRLCRRDMCDTAKENNDYNLLYALTMRPETTLARGRHSSALPVTGAPSIIASSMIPSQSNGIFTQIIYTNRQHYFTDTKRNGICNISVTLKSTWTTTTTITYIKWLSVFPSEPSSLGSSSSKFWDLTELGLYILPATQHWCQSPD